jgi:hypothetical protein
VKSTQNTFTDLKLCIHIFHSVKEKFFCALTENASSSYNHKRMLHRLVKRSQGTYIQNLRSRKWGQKPKPTEQRTPMAVVNTINAMEIDTLQPLIGGDSQEPNLTNSKSQKHESP